MRFIDPSLHRGILEWRAAPQAWERAAADNLWFEERVSAVRQERFETISTGAAGATELRQRQIDYFHEFVTVDVDNIPHTFLHPLEPADLGPIDEMQAIVRIEDISLPLNRMGDLSFERLQQAITTGETSLIENFLRTWNEFRDWRPAFAAFQGCVV